MRVVIVQAYEAPDTPAWITRCLTSVQRWAEARGYAYRYLDRDFFAYAPAWFRARCPGQLGPITDLARLYLMEALHADFDVAVWIDADVLVFDPDHLELPDTIGFVALKEVTVGLRGDEIVASEVTVNCALVAAGRGDPVFRFYRHAIEQIVRHDPRPELPRTIAGPQLLTKISRVIPMDCLTTVGLFTPAILRDLALGQDRLPAAFARHFGHRVAAANLCHFQRARVAPGEQASFDDWMMRAMDRLEATRGEVVNRFV